MVRTVLRKFCDQVQEKANLDVLQDLLVWEMY